MLEQFQKYLISEKRMATLSVDAYLFDLERFFVFIDNPNVDKNTIKKVLTYTSIRSWVSSLKKDGLSNRSINRKISSLRTFCKWCVKESFVDENPMLKITNLKQNKRLPEFVKQQEIDLEKTECLFSDDFAGLRDKLIFELFYQTGMRLSELINLKSQDIQNNTIKVLGKRNKERIIPINESLIAIITSYKEQKEFLQLECNYLLCTEKGNKLYPKFVYRKINSYLSTITKMQKKSPHVLRHTFATHMLNNGASLEAIKEVLGHANLSATQVYTHNSFKEISNIYKQAHPRG